MEKVLINENEAVANAAKYKIVDFANRVNVHIIAFFEKTEYQPKLPEIREALRNNGNPLQKGLDDLMDQQLKGIFASKLLKESLKADTERHVYDFTSKVNPLTLTERRLTSNF